MDKNIEIGIKHKILNDFVAYGKELLINRSKSIEKEIVDNVRSLLLQYSDKKKAISDLNDAFEYVHHFVRKQLCFVPIPMYDHTELRELYDEAKKVSLFEKVTKSNNKDVIRYYHALIEHTVWVCRMLLRRRTGQFLMQMVDVLSREFDVNSKWATTFNDAQVETNRENLSDDFSALVELMAENVHDTWTAGRIADGWKYGLERNDEKKEQPCLVPYSELPESEKEFDRNTAKATIAFILSHGYSIEKQTKI